VTPAIDIEHVTKRFWRRNGLGFALRRRPPIEALRDIRLSVEPGHIFILLGANGAGKTTLLKVIATLLIPDTGSGQIAGRPFPGDNAAIRSHISLAMGDEQSFYYRLTARQNLEFFAALYGHRAAGARDRIRRIARQFDLDAVLDRPYQELSTGAHQRMALGRALLNDSPILMVDEPTRSLDPAAKLNIRRLLRSLAKESGKAVLMTTHDLDEAADLADETAVLQRGTLYPLGRPDARWRQNAERVLTEADGATRPPGSASTHA